MKAIKHNSLSRAILERVLRFRCRSTRAFVFVANTGRSGSKTLADILSGIPGIAAFHEPAPKLTPDPAGGIDQTRYLESLFFEKKIFYVLRAAASHSHYVETNHLFAKTFASLAIEYFKERIRIIHLRRDPVSVAMSFFLLGQVPGHGEVARRYMLSPEDPANIIDGGFLCGGHPDFSHPFFRCLWYWYEVEARIQRTKRNHPHVPWLFLRTDDLNDRGAMRNLCQGLSIDAHVETILGRVGKRSNIRAGEKEIASADRRQLGTEQALEMDQRLRRELGGRIELGPLLLAPG